MVNVLKTTALAHEFVTDGRTVEDDIVVAGNCVVFVVVVVVVLIIGPVVVTIPGDVVLVEEGEINIQGAVLVKVVVWKTV